MFAWLHGNLTDMKTVTVVSDDTWYFILEP